MTLVNIGWPVRDRDFKIVDRLGSAPLLNAIKRGELVHIDIWSGGRRACQVGFEWADGSSAIGNLPWNAEAAIGWCQQKGVGKLVRWHCGAKR